MFISGAGPAGLAAAIAAARAGLTVQVADARRLPLDKACGEGLLPGAVAALARLGVQLTDTNSCSLHGIRFLGRSQSAEGLFGEMPGRGVSRVRLSQALLARAEELGMCFLWETTVRDVDVERRTVRTNRGLHEARWIIGADGHHSVVRKAAGLDARRIGSRRIGVRQHFRIAPWAPMVEVYWGEQSQAYVTPVAGDEVCVAILSRRHPMDFERELREFPRLTEHLRGALATDATLGGASLETRVREIVRGNVALIGDASGSVDALTGEGVALSFRQAEALVHALLASDLSVYRHAHEEIFRVPRAMSRFMLLLDRYAFLRERVLRALQRHPNLFDSILRIHIGERVPPLWGRDGVLTLGARLLLT